MPDDLLRETAALYALPRGAYTSARNARAKELRREDPQLAEAVAALPKPTVAAAALNKSARQDPSEVRALVQAGRRLREAQEAAVSGKRGRDLAAAIEEHRTALDRVQRDLRRRKLSGATLERATRTLRVASLDPELQPLLERGALHEDLTPSGFGLDPALVPVRTQRSAKPKPESKRARDERAREGRRQSARERVAAAETALEEAERRATRAQRELEQASNELERVRRELDRL